MLEQLFKASDNLDHWCRKKLPILNQKIDREKEPANLIEQFIVEAGELIEKTAIYFAELGSLSCQRQLELLAPIGFILSSLARHGITEENEPRLSTAVRMVIELGGRLGHPPRDSLYTYVISNTRDGHGYFRAFSHHRGEQNFIKFTQEAISYAEQAVGAVLGARASSNDMNESFREATKHMLSYQGCFHAMEHRDEEGKRAIEPEFFFSFFREYFPTYEIAGQSWGPPTAANASPVILLDILLGLATKEYCEHIRGRLRYFTTEDRCRLNLAMNGISLLDSFIGGCSSIPKLAEHLVDTGRVTQATELANLCKQIASASSTHWGLLIKYLVNPAKDELAKSVVATPKSNGQGCPFARLHSSNSDTGGKHIVDPSRGASGMAFPEVWNIRNMRAKNPKVIFLSDALDLISLNPLVVRNEVHV